MNGNLLECVASVVVEFTGRSEDGDGFDFENVAFAGSGGGHGQDNSKDQLKKQLQSNHFTK